jgi:hypothetical protein
MTPQRRGLELVSDRPGPRPHSEFDEIIFAVTHWSDNERFIGPFRRAFGGGRR